MVPNGIINDIKQVILLIKPGFKLPMRWLKMKRKKSAVLAY